MATNPQTSTTKVTGIRGKVYTEEVEISTVPEALSLLQQCLVQLVQAASIVLQLNGQDTQALQGLLPPAGSSQVGKVPPAPPKRTFSAAAKARMSAGMREFWKKRRAKAAAIKAQALKASKAAAAKRKQQAAKGKETKAAKPTPPKPAATKPTPPAPTSEKGE